MNLKINMRSLRIKLPLLVGILAIIGLSSVSFLAIKTAREVIITQTKSNLASIADAHGEMIDMYLKERVGDIR